MTINDSINGKSYKAFDISGFSYNNGGDVVRLYNGADTLIESSAYTSCANTQSYAKTSSGIWQPTPLITKGSANQFPVATSTPTATPLASATPTPKVSPTLDPTAEGAEVLGTSTDSGLFGSRDPTPDPTPITNQTASISGTTSGGNPPWFAYASIGLGGTSILGLGGYLWYDWYKKKKLV